MNDRYTSKAKRKKAESHLIRVINRLYGGKCAPAAKATGLGYANLNNLMNGHANASPRMVRAFSEMLDIDERDFFKSGFLDTRIRHKQLIPASRANSPKRRLQGSVDKQNVQVKAQIGPDVGALDTIILLAKAWGLSVILEKGITVISEKTQG